MIENVLAMRQRVEDAGFNRFFDMAVNTGYCFPRGLESWFWYALAYSSKRLSVAEGRTFYTANAGFKGFIEEYMSLPEAARKTGKTRCA